jgi:hypothetical protein
LGTTDLSPYFYFSRDRLSPAAPAARLSGALQQLLGRLESAIGAIRRTAVEEGLALDPGDQVQLFDSLVDRATREPRGRALDSALEIAARKPDLVPRLAAGLRAMPPTSVPMQLPAKLVAAVDPLPSDLRQLIETWRDSGQEPLKGRASEALGSAT